MNRLRTFVTTAASTFSHAASLPTSCSRERIELTAKRDEYGQNFTFYRFLFHFSALTKREPKREEKGRQDATTTELRRFPRQ